MEQGTGKTKTTIDLLANLYLAHQIAQVVIIAPNGVHRQWGKSGTNPNDSGEIEKHGFVPNKRLVWQSDSVTAIPMSQTAGDGSELALVALWR